MEDKVKTLAAALKWVPDAARADRGTLIALANLWERTVKRLCDHDDHLSTLELQLRSMRKWTLWVRGTKLRLVNRLRAEIKLDAGWIWSTTEISQSWAISIIRWLQGYNPDPCGSYWDDDTREQVQEERDQWLANWLWMNDDAWKDGKDLSLDSTASARSTALA